MRSFSGVNRTHQGYCEQKEINKLTSVDKAGKGAEARRAIFSSPFAYPGQGSKHIGAKTKILG
jgi:hypothetical protein